MIQLIDLTKSFGTHTVLNKVSFVFQNGMVFGIVGKNGAGKTTLFRCIAGLERYSGTIEAEEVPLKNHIMFLPTDPFFYKMMTGMEYVQFICSARQNKVSNISSKNIFNLPLNQYISTYSSGMKKKLALFAALLQDVDYYILDEPFNGIDFQSSMILFDLIKLLRKRNKTILISSHIFSTLKESCDEIALLENGGFKYHVSQGEFDQLESDLHAELVVPHLNLWEE